MPNFKNLSPRTLLLIVCLNFFAISGIFSLTIAHAVEYYVAKTGNDANPGTQASPFLTIRKGMTTMGGGDTLFIKTGTYAEQISSNLFTIPTGTSWVNAPVIKAFPGDMVTVQPTAGAAVVDLAASYIQYVIFEGLTFDGINGVPDISSVISLTNGANHVRFLNIEAKNATLNVVLITRGTGGTDYNEFIGGNYHHSDIWDSPNLPLGAYVFYIIGDHNLFDGLDIHDGTGYGIRTWNSESPQPSYNIIRNCRVHGNNSKKPSSSGILLGTGVGNMAYNNLVYDNRGDGIQAKAGDSALIYNNTVYNNDQDGIQIGDPWHPTTNTIIKNNISFKNGRNFTIESAPISGTIMSNNLIDGTNPLFLDPANLNFTLDPLSPAINAGITVAEVPRDFDGNARPQGSNYDVGAFEFSQLTVGVPKNFRLVTAQ